MIGVAASHPVIAYKLHVHKGQSATSSSTTLAQLPLPPLLLCRPRPVVARTVLSHLVVSFVSRY